LIATPRLRWNATVSRDCHACRHFTRHVAASSAIVLVVVVMYIVPL
jgi:hypothetical protein